VKGDCNAIDTHKTKFGAGGIGTVSGGFGADQPGHVGAAPTGATGCPPASGEAYGPGQAATDCKDDPAVSRRDGPPGGV